MSAKELNIGDYCYIKGISRDYGIGKITQLNSGYSSNGGELIDIQFKHSKHSVPKIEVISSPNITDLIKVGDYVNGYKVSAIYNPNGDGIVAFTLITATGYKRINVYIDNFEIIYIITKEQMEQMEYKVE